MRPRYRHGDGAISRQAQGTRPAIRSCRSGSILPRTWWRTHAEESRTWSRWSEMPPSWTLTFPGQQFDCICTHFITGYVPMRVLAPKIASRLKPGGYWSLVGGTKAAYPALQAKGDSKLLRWLSGAGSRKMDDTVLNPANLQEVVDTMEAHGFEVRAGETFEPALEFNDFDQFMEFGYRGGWLTPLIESHGLAQGRPGEALAAQPSRLPGHGFAQHCDCPGPQAMSERETRPIGLGRDPARRSASPVLSRLKIR